MLDRTRAFLRSTFRDLPAWKRRLLQFSLLLIVIGGAALGYAAYRGYEDPWSASALRAGLGGLLGFLISAAARLFLKIGLLLGLVVAGAVWGLSALGWIDAPWGSFGEIGSAVGGWIRDQFASVPTFFTGYLLTWVMAGVGLVSGITTRPRIDRDPSDG